MRRSRHACFEAKSQGKSPQRHTLQPVHNVVILFQCHHLLPSPHHFLDAFGPSGLQAVSQQWQQAKASPPFRGESQHQGQLLLSPGDPIELTPPPTVVARPRTVRESRPGVLLHSVSYFVENFQGFPAYRAGCTRLSISRKCPTSAS